MSRQNRTDLSREIEETPGQQEACPETLITGIGLSCIAGDQPFALLGAVGTDLSAASPNPLLKVRVQGQNSDQPVMTAPVAALDGIELPAERMEFLVVSALAEAMESLPIDIDSQKLLIVTLRPGAERARGAATSSVRLEEKFRAQNPQLKSAAFRFVDQTSGPTRQLIEVCRELAEGSWQAVLFGGVDSLVDTVSCTDLALAGRIMTAGRSEGLVPGEAAAYLLLQPPEAKPPKSLARIRAASQAVEPHAGKADSQQMTGLAAAMDQALSQGIISAASLEGVVIPFGAETAGTLEWHQTSLKLWPPDSGDPSAETEPPAERNSPREELQLHIALGETGAAALPLSLVLACARFEFDHPTRRDILVCVAGDEPLRGAVLLQAGK